MVPSAPWGRTTAAHCGHLLALEPADRYLRFGYAASDDQIRRYAEQLNFERDDIFGIYNRRLELIAMAHLAYTTPLAPELRGVRCLGALSARGAATVRACSSGP